MHFSTPFAFDNSYARELAGFYAPCQPTPSPRPGWVCFNRALAEDMGLDVETLTSDAGLSLFAGNTLPPGAEPLAQAYAGHQFGGFSPQLGDGRALLLGEVIDRQGRRRDIAFKGSGRTPFSRNGDGKCALGPALREYLMGEAMDALGIPTTRALAVVSSGDVVHRERPLPGAVLTRVAASHVRVGTFEYFAAHHGPEAVKRLADYVIARHYLELADHPAPYLALLEGAVARQASLVARWLGIGFIHGVMNTDNMTLSGETIDYGPCAFMEAYDPATVFSSIDRQGRYAYGNQPGIAQWNLARLAESLLPLIDPDSDRAVEAAVAVVSDFHERFDAQYLAILRAKLGIDDTGCSTDDRALADAFLALLQENRMDFTNAFRALYDLASGDTATWQRLTSDAGLAEWMARWQQRQPQRSPELLAAMGRANPWVIPRNHQVEAALNAAVDQGDLAPFERLLEVLQTPFTARPEAMAYTEPAAVEVTAAYRTFCGT